jgi:hypothetical protein
VSLLKDEKACKRFSTDGSLRGTDDGPRTAQGPRTKDLM